MPRGSALARAAFALAVALGLGALVALAAPPARAAQPLRVVATLEPLCMLAREIGGERVACSVLVPPGASPHAFEPRPSALRAVADADLLLRAGNGIDDWAERLALAGERAFAIVGPRCGSNEPACAHFWLDPALVDSAIDQLGSRLAERDPRGRELYQAGASRLRIDLRAVEDPFRDFRGAAFVSLHPAWGGFARHFGLVELGAIQDHGAEEPTPRQLGELIARARAAKVRTVLVESQLDPHTARIVAEELGARVVTVDPLGDPRDPERSDYVALLAWNVQQIAAGMAEVRP